MRNSEDILKEVKRYYSKKIDQYGIQPQGVDWNGIEGQLKRFDILLNVVRDSSDFSINDLGCGYGALLHHMIKSYDNFHYAGYDVSHEMIKEAIRNQNNHLSAEFFTSSTMKESDYTVASGIFNVRGNRNDREWKDYLYDTLNQMDKASRKGFSFNCLTSYSDKEKMRDYLYYADPLELFNFCKRNYSRNVALFHDYDLYEFTLIIRK